MPRSAAARAAIPCCCAHPSKSPTPPSVIPTPQAPNPCTHRPQTLLQAGARAESKDDDGSTPLHYASASGNLGMLKSLLEGGASVAAVTDDGCTPVRQRARTPADTGRCQCLFVCLGAAGRGSDPACSSRRHPCSCTWRRAEDGTRR